MSPGCRGREVGLGLVCHPCGGAGAVPGRGTSPVLRGPRPETQRQGRPQPFWTDHYRWVNPNPFGLTIVGG